MTHSRTFAAKTAISLTAGAALLASLTPAPMAHAKDRPVTDSTVTAGDVAITPIEDLNLAKDDIPPLLLKAQEDIYATRGLRYCRDYAAAVRELDTVLGPDMDVADPEKRKLTVGKAAKSVVGSFIPFRGIIREVSGANSHEHKFQQAIIAGFMRRSFLKGMGLKLGCAYPARPADDATRARMAALAAEAEEQDD